MPKRSGSKKSAPSVDPFVEGLMSKLMDRLEALERKIDTVITQTGRNTGVSAPRPNQPAQMNYSSPHPMVQPKRPSHHERVMHEAICADCGDPCEVPFRPTPERAIYCKPCFAKRKSESRLPAPPAASRPQAPVFAPPSPTASTAAVATQPVPPAKKAKPAVRAAKKAKKKK